MLATSPARQQRRTGDRGPAARGRSAPAAPEGQPVPRARVSPGRRHDRRAAGGRRRTGHARRPGGAPSPARHWPGHRGRRARNPRHRPLGLAGAAAGHARSRAAFPLSPWRRSGTGPPDSQRPPGRQSRGARKRCARREARVRARYGRAARRDDPRHAGRHARAPPTRHAGGGALCDPTPRRRRGVSAQGQGRSPGANRATPVQPFRKRWLPVLHTERGAWHFTALFSNTARAHELGRTRDWVVVYFRADHEIRGSERS